MKPPMTKFRLGDYFGANKKELTGFIKSLNYTVPEESTWSWGQKERAPRYIVATISYQVIHDVVPSITTKFYGHSAVQDATNI